MKMSESEFALFFGCLFWLLLFGVDAESLQNNARFACVRDAVNHSPYFTNLPCRNCAPKKDSLC